MGLKEYSPYIIWDGSSVSLYRSTKYHDYVVMQDGLISVQNLRRDCILSGVEPIIIFSCKPGMSSFEVNYPDHGWGGLFTQSMVKVMYRGITVRDLISKINIEMNKSGLNQICEVVCRLKFLDIEYLTGNYLGNKIAYFQFDMCRTLENLGLKITNK
jgi:hypothetical protein